MRKENSKSQRLQRPRRRAFEEPACADAQAMMPGRQSRRVHCEARLARQRTAHYFAAGQNCCVFRSQAYGFTELNEVLRFQFATIQERLNVAGAKMRLLQC